MAVLSFHLLGSLAVDREVAVMILIPVLSLISSYFNIADLSFNNIEVIEGLDKLTKLKDLTLYNNRISKIENMDSLSQLHVFSVGNNSLKQLDDVSTQMINRFH